MVSKKETEAFADENVIAYPDNGTGVEVESIDTEEKIIEPFDPTKIRVDTKPMTIGLLLDRIAYQELDLQPGFQRKAGLWSEGVQSRLIESLLIRIPLPAFYMDATEEDRWIVVDGLQRLTTLKRFVLDKTLVLQGLEFLTWLNGKRYDALPRNLQRRIAETQITVYLIEKGSPDEVKFNIFKRINTEGLPLSTQEIRHALNQGKAAQLLADLASSTEFQRAVDNGIRDDRMADRECVLRFLAFTITPYTTYDGDFDSFLNHAMAQMNKYTDEKLADLSCQFRRAMTAARDIFGRDAFRKRYRETAPRMPINKPLFESWSVNLNQLTDDQLQSLKMRKDVLREKFIDLMNDRNLGFNEAISLSTGSKTKVQIRFSAIEQLIKEVLV